MSCCNWFRTHSLWLYIPAGLPLVCHKRTNCECLVFRPGRVEVASVQMHRVHAPRDDRRRCYLIRPSRRRPAGAALHPSQGEMRMEGARLPRMSLPRARLLDGAPKCEQRLAVPLHPKPQDPRAAPRPELPHPPGGEHERARVRHPRRQRTLQCRKLVARDLTEELQRQVYGCRRGPASRWAGGFELRDSRRARRLHRFRQRKRNEAAERLSHGAWRRALTRRARDNSGPGCRCRPPPRLRCRPTPLPVGSPSSGTGT